MILCENYKKKLAYRVSEFAFFVYKNVAMIRNIYKKTTCENKWFFYKLCCFYFFACMIAACAAAKRAIGTRNGEHET